MSLEGKLGNLTATQKKALLAKLKQKKSSIEKVSGDSRVPLTPNQQRLRFLEEFHGPSDQYHISFIIDIEGELEIALLNKAIAQLISRHRILRCQIGEIEQESYQYVDDSLDISLEQIGPVENVEDSIVTFVRKPFSFKEGALVRFGLCTQASNKFTFVLVVHHIIFDAGSTKTLFDELIENYQQLLYQTTQVATIPSFDFLDYAHYIANHKNKIEAEFWFNKFEGASFVHHLPLEKERSKFTSNLAEDYLVTLPEPLAKSIFLFTKENRCSNNLLFTTVFSAFIARWGQEPDVILGVPYSHREREEFDNALGFFINNLIYRANIDNYDCLEQLLPFMKQQQIDNIANAHTPFDAVVELINPERSDLHSPIFQICMNYQKSSVKDVAFGGLSFQAKQPPAARAKFDLVLTVIESTAGFALEWKYNRDIFLASTIKNVANGFSQFLANCLDSPRQKFELLPLACLQPNAGELADLSIYREANLFEQFSQQVNKTPTAIAFDGDDKRVSYQELYDQVRLLAQLLIEKGIQSSSVVAIELPSGIEYIRSVLAVIASGATYVSLDIKAPHQRNDYIFDDSGAKLLIDRNFVASNFAHIDTGEITSTTPIYLDDKGPAYICYTSGTTGKPKGVAVSHQSVISLANSQFVPLNENSHVLMCSNTAFDAMTFEMWAPILTGGTICHYPDRFVEPAALFDLIHTKNINTAFITTALFRIYVASLRSEQKHCALDYLMVGGEKALAVDYVYYYQQSDNTQAFNIYGPTECTTFATIYPVPRTVNTHHQIPIGMPIEDAFACILNQQGHWQPQGMIGELYLGGRGVATYLNNESLNKEKFVTLSVNSSPQRVWHPQNNIRLLAPSRNKCRKYCGK